jgi:transcriptional regulator with XRE-family HTH domain
MREGWEAAEDWAAVAQAITGRLEQLRMTQMEAASQAKISLTTLRELQNNTNPRRRRPQTLAALSQALGWPPEYLSKVLHGEDARIRDVEADDPVLKAMDSIERDLRDLRQRVTQIERRLADEDA